MIAHNLSRQIWNGIADLVGRNRGQREIYFVKVARADAKKNLIWVKDFGELAIPLVSHGYSFAYYDTIPVGNVTSGQPVDTNFIRREDKTNTNKNFQTEVICPKKGDLVVVLDPWGAKRFPVCIGLIQSSSGFWEGE